jgi:hypothetical protein
MTTASKQRWTFSLRTLFWFTSLSAAFVLFCLVRPFPETSQLDGHQRGFAFLMDAGARGLLCVLIGLMPTIFRNRKSDGKHGWLWLTAPQWVVMAIVFLPIMTLVVLCQLMRAFS